MRHHVVTQSSDLGEMKPRYAGQGPASPPLSLLPCFDPRKDVSVPTPNSHWPQLSLLGDMALPEEPVVPDASPRPILLFAAGGGPGSRRRRSAASRPTPAYAAPRHGVSSLWRVAEVCCGACSMEPLMPFTCTSGHGNPGNPGSHVPRLGEVLRDASRQVPHWPRPRLASPSPAGRTRRRARPATAGTGEGPI